MFKRITIELILLNPTKFEQIRKFSNEKKKKCVNLNYPCTSTYKPYNLILPFKQKNNEVISLRRLKDMIRYKYLVEFSFSTSIKRSCQYFFCNFRKLAIPRYGRKTKWIL